MEKFYLPLIIIFISVIYLFCDKIKNKKNKPENIFPYQKKLLLTKTEYTFYNILKPLCEQNDLIICPKVRLEDFIEVTDKDNKQKYRNHIRTRHIDFLICDYKLNIIAAIELDDNSHNSTKAKETDNFKNQLYNTINIPLYRIKTKSKYTDEIYKIIKELKNKESLTGEL